MIPFIIENFNFLFSIYKKYDGLQSTYSLTMHSGDSTNRLIFLFKWIGPSAADEIKGNIVQDSRNFFFYENSFHCIAYPER